MKYEEKLRDSKLAGAFKKRISGLMEKEGRFNLMEVCGTHTMAIHRYGIRSFLQHSITLISGPGCPVCVTPVHAFDKAIALLQKPDVVLATFGDAVSVPGSESSLKMEKAKGKNVIHRIVYLLPSIQFLLV